jgi:demethylmenaquinone methyltransferase/2-methoxy-6-polyprenyl-1,4-benzoquinol methylase
LRFRVADVSGLAGTGAFDAVLVFSCFPHFQDPLAVLCRLRAQLRPGGRLAVCHLKSSQEINDFHRHVHPQVSSHRLPAAAEMCDLFERAALAVTTAADESGFYLVAGGWPRR